MNDTEDSMMATTPRNDDSELSKCLDESLTISQTKEVRSLKHVEFQWPKKQHDGFYSSQPTLPTFHNAQENTIEVIDADVEFQRLCLGDGSSSRSSGLRPTSSGVPGFSDFPDCWTGEEGWTVWERGRRSKSQRSSKPLKRVVRQAVNEAGTRSNKKLRRRGTAVYKPRMQKARKADRRKKVLEQHRTKRQLRALQREMRKLSCS